MNERKQRIIGELHAQQKDGKVRNTIFFLERKPDNLRTVFLSFSRELGEL